MRIVRVPITLVSWFIEKIKHTDSKVIQERKLKFACILRFFLSQSFNFLNRGLWMQNVSTVCLSRNFIHRNVSQILHLRSCWPVFQSGDKGWVTVVWRWRTLEGVRESLWLFPQSWQPQNCIFHVSPGLDEVIFFPLTPTSPGRVDLDWDYALYSIGTISILKNRTVRLTWKQIGSRPQLPPWWGWQRLWKK